MFVKSIIKSLAMFAAIVGLVAALPAKVLAQTSFAQDSRNTQDQMPAARRALAKVMEHANTRSDNGSYKGQIGSGGTRDGLGIYRWYNGDYYFGGYSGGSRHGYGVLVLRDGQEFTGYRGAVIYAGNWNNDTRSGTGTFYDKFGNLLYTGNFANGRPTGAYPSTGNYSSYKFEVFEGSGCDRYVGETRNEQRHGFGAYVWRNGNVWFGDWNNGARNGNGIFMTHNASRWEISSCSGDDCAKILASDDVDYRELAKTTLARAMQYVSYNFNNGSYKGQISNGQLNGFGIYRWRNGEHHIGGWTNGAEDGMGIRLASDGNEISGCRGAVIYVGDWENGNRTGVGDCYDRYGNLLYSGEFVNGRPTETYPSDEDLSDYKFRVINMGSGNDKYIGSTTNGQPSDYGVYVWGNGNIWIGGWENGIRDSYGLFISHNANYWEITDCNRSGCAKVESSDDYAVHQPPQQQYQQRHWLDVLVDVAEAVNTTAQTINQIRNPQSNTGSSSNVGGGALDDDFGDDDLSTTNCAVLQGRVDKYNSQIRSRSSYNASRVRRNRTAVKRAEVNRIVNDEVDGNPVSAGSYRLVNQTNTEIRRYERQRDNVIRHMRSVGCPVN